VSTMSHGSFLHCDVLVTGETSVSVFTMHSSGFILGIANRYHGYNNVSLRRCVAMGLFSGKLLGRNDSPSVGSLSQYLSVHFTDELTNFWAILCSALSSLPFNGDGNSSAELDGRSR
jgi:hypothetical protein